MSVDTSGTKRGSTTGGRFTLTSTAKPDKAMLRAALIRNSERERSAIDRVHYVAAFLHSPPFDSHQHITEQLEAWFNARRQLILKLLSELHHVR